MLNENYLIIAHYHSKGLFRQDFLNLLRQQQKKFSKIYLISTNLKKKEIKKISKKIYVKIRENKDLINNYYQTVFKWLSKCEQFIGFNLEGYNQVRMYAFLAERFMPYWFKKNSKVLEWPIIFDDLNKY